MPDAATVEAILLGIVQGIAEFLPISSSGHLVVIGELVERWFGTQIGESQHLLLNVSLHVGTLGSILVVYRSELIQLIRRPRLCLAIVVATIPAGVVGVTFQDQFERLFATPLVAGCCFLITAGLLLIGQGLGRNEHELDATSFRQALTIGAFQAIALLPGISRSGSTIAGGLLLGLQREAATTFSFLIAIPAIGGAALLTAKDAWQSPAATYPVVPLLFGMIVSFLVGLVCLRWLIRLVSDRKLHWFAYYCLVVGAATILWQIAERVAVNP